MRARVRRATSPGTLAALPLLAAVAALAALTPAKPAQAQPVQAEAQAPAPAPPATVPPPQRFVTRHEVTVGGERIAFTATAGETYLYDDVGEPIASIFSYAYVRDVPEGTSRPVTFLFGGGPGSASLALHVGGLGPWAVPHDRFEPTPGGIPMGPPYELVENPNSLLDVSDLVFVDPVGTGYSRPIGAGETADFWGIDQDAESMAQFVHRWVTSHGRWDSPKIYVGASYGGYRAAALARALTAGPFYLGYYRGVTFQGIAVLVNHLGGSLGGGPGLGRLELAALELPSQALTAWYHGAVDRADLSQAAWYEDAVAFAEETYLPALRRDSAGTLSAEDRATVLAGLTRLTGLPPSAYAERLMLPSQQFARMVLADRGLYVGTYDGRYTLPLAASGGDPVADDPILAPSFAVFAGAQANVEHHRLGVRMDRPFVSVHWRDLLPGWDMTRLPAAVPGPPTFAGTPAEELAVIMNRDPDVEVLIGTGMYDLVMPSAVADYVVERTPFDRDRLTVRAYPSGHELYFGAGAALAEDLRGLIRRASR